MLDFFLSLEKVCHLMSIQPELQARTQRRSESHCHLCANGTSTIDNSVHDFDIAPDVIREMLLGQA